MMKIILITIAVIAFICIVISFIEYKMDVKEERDLKFRIDDTKEALLFDTDIINDLLDFVTKEYETNNTIFNATLYNSIQYFNTNIYTVMIDLNTNIKLLLTQEPINKDSKKIFLNVKDSKGMIHTLPFYYTEDFYKRIFK